MVEAFDTKNTTGRTSPSNGLTQYAKSKFGVNKDMQEIDHDQEIVIANTNTYGENF